MMDEEISQWQRALETFEEKLSEEMAEAEELAWDIMYAVRGIARAIRHTFDGVDDDKE